MSTDKTDSANVTEVWSKLSNCWKDTATQRFYHDYIVKMLEAEEDFKQACANLKDVSEVLSKELSAIEISLQN